MPDAPHPNQPAVPPNDSQENTSSCLSGIGGGLLSMLACVALIYTYFILSLAYQKEILFIDIFGGITTLLMAVLVISVAAFLLGMVARVAGENSCAYKTAYRVLVGVEILLIIVGFVVFLFTPAFISQGHHTRKAKDEASSAQLTHEVQKLWQERATKLQTDPEFVKLVLGLAYVEPSVIVTPNPNSGSEAVSDVVTTWVITKPATEVLTHFLSQLPPDFDDLPTTLSVADLATMAAAGPYSFPVTRPPEIRIDASIQANFIFNIDREVTTASIRFHNSRDGAGRIQSSDYKGGHAFRTYNQRLQKADWLKFLEERGIDPVALKGEYRDNLGNFHDLEFGSVPDLIVPGKTLSPEETSKSIPLHSNGWIKLGSNTYEMNWIPNSPVEIECDSYRQETTSTTVMPFWIGQTEVTQAIFFDVTGYNPANAVCPECPVYNLSDVHVDFFLNDIRQLTGLHLDLPTEAEWQAAAEGGVKSKFFFGEDSDQLSQYAWCRENDPPAIVMPVGQKLPNPYGLFDVYGNVSERCLYYVSCETGDLKDRDCARGGDSGSDAYRCTSWKRDSGGSSSGLRLVLRTQPPPP